MQSEKQVVQWGNSLGVRISKVAAARAGISRGSSVYVKAEPGKITLVPIRKSDAVSTNIPRYSLKKLLRGVTAKNLKRDDAFLNAPATGQEIL